jgi:Protein of unknown function (DUF4238)
MLHVSAAGLVIGAAAGKGDKHHYISVFYSQEWAGLDGRVCEYSRPYDAVKPRRVHPSGTGYVRGLYTVPRNDPRVSEFIEREFLKVTDNEAARVLQSLKRGGEIIWAVETRSAWSRFILSLMLRNPEYVRRVAAEVAGFFDPSSTELNDRYRAIRKAGDPETYAEYIALTGHPAGRTSAVAMQTIIDSPRMGGQLNRMRWSVIGFRNERHPLLTSDRPIIMTNGMVKPESHLALPIGPRMLFLATNTLEMEREIRSMSPRQLMEHVNDRVVSQARKYVWGVDDKQLQFVQNWLGRMERSSPLDPQLPT